MKSRLVPALLLLAACAAHAGEDDVERERIKLERQAVTARFAEEEKACRAKFAVTDCVEKARRERAAALADLRRQERVLNDAERRRRAADRQKAFDERNSPASRAEAEERRRQSVLEQRAREARAADKAQKKAEEDAARGARVPRVAKTPSGPPRPQGSPRTPQAAKPNGPTPEEAARNKAAFEARIREAEAHNEQLRERLARRKKPAASDLPVPP